MPIVAPQSDVDDEAFAELDDILSSGNVSSAIGWAIRTGEGLEGKKREEILSFSRKLKGLFTGRVCKNWAMPLFFVDKVTKR